LPANRLLNARAIYTITSSLSDAQLDQLLDAGYDVNVNFPAGTTLIEIDFRGGVGLGPSATFVYSQGLHIFYPLDGWSSGSFAVEYWTGSQWVSGPSTAIISRKITFLTDTIFRSGVSRLRYSISTAAAATGRILEFYPADIGALPTTGLRYQLGHDEQFDCLLTRAINPQVLYGPSLTVADRQGNRTAIGEGRMSANNLPVYADHATAGAALSKGAYYQLTGDPTLYAKP
jgi:hypothetical protein